MADIFTDYDPAKMDKLSELLPAFMGYNDFNVDIINSCVKLVVLRLITVSHALIADEYQRNGRDGCFTSDRHRVFDVLSNTRRYPFVVAENFEKLFVSYEGHRLRWSWRSRCMP